MILLLHVIVLIGMVLHILKVVFTHTILSQVMIYFYRLLWISLIGDGKVRVASQMMLMALVIARYILGAVAVGMIFPVQIIKDT